MYNGLGVTNPDHPKMAVCGHARRFNARWKCLRNSLMFEKFGRGASDGGLATRAVTSS